MNTVIVVLKRTCEFWNIADTAGKMTSFMCFCVSSELYSEHILIAFVTEAEALFRDFCRLEYKAVASGSSQCSANGIVMHLVNARDRLDPYCRFVVRMGSVLKR